MITRAKSIAFAAAAAAALTPWPATSLAQAASLAPEFVTAKTVVYGFGGHCPPTNWANPAVRPSRAYFSLACENGVSHISWSSWRRTSAVGHATILIFNGIGFNHHRGTISLSTVRRHHGRRYFAHLVMKWVTPNGKHHKEVLNWQRDGTFWIWVGNFGGTTSAGT